MSVDPAIVRALALRPDSPPGDHVIDITTIGAKSGQPRRIEIWIQRVEGHWYLTSIPVPRKWDANLRKNPRFTVHLKRGVRADLPATAVPVDEETRRRVITAVVAQQRLPEYAAIYPRQNIDDWLRYSALHEIVFDDEEIAKAASAV
jgi:deazaflavin-dependent oxidoreductase (nitroreductase family)